MSLKNKLEKKIVIMFNEHFYKNAKKLSDAES